MFGKSLGGQNLHLEMAHLGQSMLLTLSLERALSLSVIMHVFSESSAEKERIFRGREGTARAATANRQSQEGRKRRKGLNTADATRQRNCLRGAESSKSGKKDVQMKLRKTCSR